MTTMKTRRIFVVAMMGVAGGVLSGTCDGALVMNQIGNANAYDVNAQVGPNSSQIFTDWTDFQCMAIDDFSVNESELKITNIAALVWAQNGYASFQNVTSYQVSVFSVAGMASTTLLGDAGNLLVNAGSGVSVTRINGGDNAVVSIDVNLTLPAVGTYWVGVAPVASSNIGQFFIQNSGAQGVIKPGNGNGRFANPGDGFGYGDPKPYAVDVNFAYAITAVPEPAASVLLLLGGCAWFCRRQRA